MQFAGSDLLFFFILILWISYYIRFEWLISVMVLAFSCFFFLRHLIGFWTFDFVFSQHIFVCFDGYCIPFHQKCRINCLAVEMCHVPLLLLCNNNCRPKCKHKLVFFCFFWLQEFQANGAMCELRVQFRTNSRTSHMEDSHINPTQAQLITFTLMKFSIIIFLFLIFHAIRSY